MSRCSMYHGGVRNVTPGNKLVNGESFPTNYRLNLSRLVVRQGRTQVIPASVTRKITSTHLNVLDSIIPKLSNYNPSLRLKTNGLVAHLHYRFFKVDHRSLAFADESNDRSGSPCFCFVAIIEYSYKIL